MPDIKLHRRHELGLDRAREVASRWAREVESKFAIQCTVVEGRTSDTVQFERHGVDGELVVAADHFALQARLGFLLGAFSTTIEAEIEKHLDALLAASAGPVRSHLPAATPRPRKK